jgi:hypothetical protein
MNKLKQCLLFIIASALSATVSAQTTYESSGWLAWFNSYKLSGHWSLHFDGQIRSANDWTYVRNILLRPGITYHFNARNNVTLGYAYIETYQRLTDESKNTFSENRIWEQYVNNIKFARASLQNRFRLEQRFIERQTNHVFAQRLRYFVRTMIPLTRQKNSFQQGVFAAVQNEIFLNIQNKDKINNSFFDQNRIYAAIGYRFNVKVDLEAGYMNQYINGMTTDVSNNIIQMALYTRF